MRCTPPGLPVEEGVVAGGGVALVRALDAVSAVEGDNEDQNVGVAIATRAMSWPLRQIAINAGVEGAVVFDKVEALDGNQGFNAASGEYGDMLAMGILDPAKVVRSALQSAASVAGLMITTEAMVSELPEDKPPPMPGGGGGMPDMGGMMCKAIPAGIATGKPRHARGFPFLGCRAAAVTVRPHAQAFPPAENIGWFHHGAAIYLPAEAAMASPAWQRNELAWRKLCPRRKW